MTKFEQSLELENLPPMKPIEIGSEYDPYRKDEHHEPVPNQ